MDSHDEGAAMCQLGLGGLQLCGLAARHGVILAPVELERLARQEDQRHECPAPAGLVVILNLGLPPPGKGGHPVSGAIVTQLHRINLRLLGGRLLCKGASLLGRTGTFKLGATTSEVRLR